MNNFPCKDCITFAICKGIYKEAYLKEKRICYISSRRSLTDRCTILSDWLIGGEYATLHFKENVRGFHNYFVNILGLE